MDYILRAIVGAGSTQDAFIVLHISHADHTVYVQAHRAVSRASLAVNALVRLCFQAQRRPLEEIADLPPDDHERRHPADVMATCPPTNDNGKSQKDSDDNVVDHEPGRWRLLQHCETTL